MIARREALQDILEAAQVASKAYAHDSRAKASLAHIFGALETSREADSGIEARRPGCEHLTSAADPLRFAEPSLRRLILTFLRLEPALTWGRRGSAPAASPDFPEGQANAMLVELSAFEPRQYVWLGVSLLALRVRYPDHTPLCRCAGARARGTAGEVGGGDPTGQGGPLPHRHGALGPHGGPARAGADERGRATDNGVADRLHLHRPHPGHDICGRTARDPARDFRAGLDHWHPSTHARSRRPLAGGLPADGHLGRSVMGASRGTSDSARSARA